MSTKSEEITILVNSKYGSNKSADGHSFVQRLQPPIRVPAIMLKDKTSDPETGEKSVMCAKYFMAEMQKYD